jgi:hypothetical protein
MSISEAESEFTASKEMFLVQQLNGTSVPMTDRAVIVPWLEKVSLQYQKQTLLLTNS